MDVCRRHSTHNPGPAEWKAMWKHANPHYIPASSTKVIDYLLPRESGYVRGLSLQQLRGSKNLSLTFDGNTTRFPQSIYTVHILTPERRAYLFEGNEASEESHDADHLFRLVSRVSHPIYNKST